MRRVHLEPRASLHCRTVSEAHLLTLCMQASVEMMSPKSDAGLSSGPALPGFGAFGQPAGGPSSASGGAGTTVGFGASGPAFSGALPFGAAGGAMTFGSTDSRSGNAFGGAFRAEPVSNSEEQSRGFATACCASVL